MEVVYDIEHTRTRVRHPQTNGSVERLHQTIQNEFYQVAFRKKIYSSILQTFLEGQELYQKYVFENMENGEAAL